MTTPISLRIHKEWLVLLRALKQRDGTNVNHAINHAIQDYLAKQYNCQGWQLRGIAQGMMQQQPPER